jgi:hypothetical protein
MGYLYLLIIMSVASSCNKDKIWKDDELSIKKVPYQGNQLRIDGYFYQSSPSIDWTRVFFFYRNGIVLESYIENATGKLEVVTNYSKARYGVFENNSNIIRFEKWYPSSGGGLPAYVRSGDILNDTTFIITESYRMKNGKKTEVKVRNETYQFKQYSPKPDSTNTFIK